MRVYDVPGSGRIVLEHLVLDLNGTLADRGRLIDGVEDRLDRLAGGLALHLVTADTFGSASGLAERLPVTLSRISLGTDKAAYVRELGPGRTVAIGNGRNDQPMLALAAIGIAIIGPEGAATGAIAAADVAFSSILDALDWLLDERAVASTLRD